MDDTGNTKLKILAFEPWYAESHRVLFDGLASRADYDWALITLPRARWRWRMRIGSVTLARMAAAHLDEAGPADLLMASGYVNLPQLVALEPRLFALPKIAVHPEDQITHPQVNGGTPEPEFTAIHLATALLADALVFCSNDQRERFATGLVDAFGKTPDFSIEDLAPSIEAKSRVIPIGVDFEPFDAARKNAAPKDGPLRVVWPHRFERDKGPDEFFNVLFDLFDEGLDFRVSAIGREYGEVPDVFAEAKDKLADRIVAWGYQEGTAYADTLASADVVVSTALQETQGLAVIEAMRAGCEPLLPDRLSYPEVLGGDAGSHTYSSTGDLRRKLRWMMKHPDRVRAWPDHAARVERFGWGPVTNAYRNLIAGTLA